MEQTDGGDSCGSGVEAGVGVGGGDAAEGEDGDGLGSKTGGAEEVQAGASGDFFVGDGFFGDLNFWGRNFCDDFFEDGAEEDESGAVLWCGRCCAGNFGEGVAGEADDGFGQGCGGVEGADLHWGE